MNSSFLSDGYKYSHPEQYPDNTRLVYCNLTPRSNKYAPKGCEEVVVFGTTMTIKYIHRHFQNNFFDQPFDKVIGELKEEMTMYLGRPFDTSRFEALHKLGYLPIKVKALEEGTVCPIKVPVFTIVNTISDFFWLPNFLESILSNLIWKPMTSASIAYGYRKVLQKGLMDTDVANKDFVMWQGHDFSLRGLDSLYAAESSGLGHLLSFFGTDSLPAIIAARSFYNAKGFVGGSVPATEHSVMCAGTKDGEFETYSRLLDIYKDYPILSIVSDTWDLWHVLTSILPLLKDRILAGTTKVVIRPDSGDPVDIICGDAFDTTGEYRYVAPEDYDGTEKDINEYKGVVELLWDVFGGTVNAQGYKVLHPNIGCIYGDSITIERAGQIIERLKAKGFASSNVVLGVGSFTYQYNTRDTYGFAMKATYVEMLEPNPKVDKKFSLVSKNIFKDPITDDGMKKSATGLLQVFNNRPDAGGGDQLFDGKDDLRLNQEVTWEQEAGGLLKTIYLDGEFYNEISFEQIRKNLWP